MKFPSSCSPMACHFLLWVRVSDGPVGKPLAAHGLSCSFSLAAFPSFWRDLVKTHTFTMHTRTHKHKPLHQFSRPLEAVRVVLFWPGPIRPAESVNLCCPGRKAISGRSYWASLFNAVFEGQSIWRGKRAKGAFVLKILKSTDVCIFQTKSWRV